MEKVIAEPTAGTLLLKQLDFENANSTCKGLIRPVCKTGTMEDYERACQDINPAVIQGLAIAAALKGESNSQFVKTINQGPPTKPKNSCCYNCGPPGHFSRECPYEKSKNCGAPPAPALPLPLLPAAQGEMQL